MWLLCLKIVQVTFVNIHSQRNILNGPRCFVVEVKDISPFLTVCAYHVCAHVFLFPVEQENEVNCLCYCLHPHMTVSQLIC